MGEELDSLDPCELEPLHEPNNERFLQTLIEDMQSNGWTDRPLLVIATENGFVAWTGSHRIAAAREAGLSTVPCYVLDESALRPFEVDAKNGHAMDHERLDIMQKLGDPDAISLMQQDQ
jgi:ParB-like chromosome segregation protein Spo0J